MLTTGIPAKAESPATGGRMVGPMRGGLAGDRPAGDGFDLPMVFSFEV